MVGQRLPGDVVDHALAALPTGLAPDEVVRTPLSSKNTKRSGASVGAASCHAALASATSARACSAACTVS